MEAEWERKRRHRLQHILQLAEDDNHQTDITQENVTLATELIYRKIYSDYDLLYVVSALNLLNAAVKRREFRNAISYGRFKGQVSRILNYLTTVERGRFNAEFYINPDESCAYIEVGGLQFSFHNISLTDRLRTFIQSPENRIKPWKGIRLQRVAGELFRYATQTLIMNSIQR